MSGDMGGGGTVPAGEGETWTQEGVRAPVCSMMEKSPRESPDEVVGPREEGGSPGR